MEVVVRAANREALSSRLWLFQGVPDGLDVFVYSDWLAGHKEEYGLVLPVFFYVNDVDRIHINVAPSAFELHEFQMMAPQRWEPEI